ncbi:MAG: hypothetical protein FWG61_07705 [Firmicutes bacterium]|nr:hypothetical protein [Bacillota bacterium]
MKKLLVILIFLSIILCLFACIAQQPTENEPAKEIPFADEKPTDEPENAEPAYEATLAEINIYHLGIRTPLEINEENALVLARQFMLMLEKAVEMDSMEAPPPSALNPDQVKNGHTALELIYMQDIDLPLSFNEEVLTVRRLLFYIPNSSSEGGLLYFGQELYEENPLGCLFEQSLQNSIYNNATDQIERVTFAADGNDVLINGQSYHYTNNEDESELSGRLLNRLLYRAIAFYLSVRTGTIDSLQAMSTGLLYEAVLKAHAGLYSDYNHGEEIIAGFNQKILVDYFFPQTIYAPVQQGEKYKITIQFNEEITIELYYVIEEDLPLLDALMLITSE